MGNTSLKGKGLTRDIDSTEDYGPAVVPSSFSYTDMTNNKGGGGEGGGGGGRGGREEGVTNSERGKGVRRKHSNKVPTPFEWSGKALKCSVAGTFNDWQFLIPMARHPPHSPLGTTFKTTIELSEGDYEYKFFADDRWVCNPDMETSVNAYGTQNNVLRVREVGERVAGIIGDVMEALDEDDDDNQSPTKGPYGQVIPTATNIPPPTLPRHLLQIILNRKIPDHIEPTLLPEPNHVMLNHLYALSIKDGVMVLSTTHRYRRKYITTLFYTPI